MDVAIIILVSFVGSGLTLFSGFGLGTILTPVFGLFFPIELAIGLTAVVHLLNNVFKLLLLGKQAHSPTILRFGLPSLIAALAGALLLSRISGMEAIAQYQMWQGTYNITIIKLVIGALLIFFSLFEILPALSNLQFPPKYLVLGGLLSGFFGGLSGNQGALRSAFLIRAGLSKEQYIASGVVIACMIDVSRLGVYSQKIFSVPASLLPMLILATLSAFAGAYIGNKLVKKITVKTLQYFVAAALGIFGVLLATGIL